ncbi:MAG TPA: NUDIX domain-containing protein [Firmicutes bacterium]|nr:NUDIX domain-containing protein [Candidatus Fermentithermobacillaceae bacterium]
MLDLREYVPNGRVSTGLLAYYDGFTVWSLSPRRYWTKTQDGTLMGLIGIGGGQEPGESLVQTVKREALEEAGADIEIQGGTPTVWAYEDGRSETRDLSGLLDDGEPSPILVWQMDIPWISDDGQRRKMPYVVAVYLARFLCGPEPKTESPGLVFVSEDQLLSLLGGPRSLSEMVSQGTRLKTARREDFAADPSAEQNSRTADGSTEVGSTEVGSTAEGETAGGTTAIPNDTVVQLHGSALYLARHWGQLALPGRDH